MTVAQRPARIFEVRRRPGARSQGVISLRGVTFPCALGKGGIRLLKREGDGATPVARMKVLRGYFRRDGVVAPRTSLPMTPIRADLGWCEVPSDRNYNRPVRMPYAASHETMRRKDNLYDACIVLDWNIRPRRRNCGSAIFFHLARPGYTPTEGCIAVSARTMQRLLPLLPGAAFRVHP